MKLVNYLFGVGAIVFLFGCGSSQHFIKDGINVNAYKYIYVVPFEKYDSYGAVIYLKELFKKESLIVIDEADFKKMKFDEQIKTLICYPGYQEVWEPFFQYFFKASVEIKDYFGEKIYSGQGDHRWGFSSTGKLEGAFESALNRFFESYIKHDLNLQTSVKNKFNDWEKINISEEQLKEKLSTNLGANFPIEGIWTSMEDNQYRIGIINETSNSKRDFVGYILETTHPMWENQQVKIEFKKTAYSSVYTTTYYMGDHTPQGTTAFINDAGFLEIKLKNPDNTQVQSLFIKNYPVFENNSLPSINKPNAQSSGSGFFISQSGLVVTNWHVVENGSDLEVQIPKLSKKFKATVKIKDKNNDIAILQLIDFKYKDIYSLDIPYLISSTNTLKQGHKVFTLGFPLGDILGEESKLSDGMVSSLFGLQDDPRLIQISNPIQPGNSGGPLFTSNGELTGIVVASLNAKYFYEKANIIPQNVNFAIKSDYLLNLISMLPEEKEITSRVSKLNNLPLDKQVESIAPFVVKIISK